MQFIKTFGLLLLLALGNTSIASAFVNNSPQVQENNIEFQFSEDHHDLFESTLIASAEVHSNHTILLGAIVPEQLCSRKISRAGSYLIYSRTLIPSQDISAIIFPFHTFL